MCAIDFHQAASQPSETRTQAPSAWESLSPSPAATERTSGKRPLPSPTGRSAQEQACTSAHSAQECGGSPSGGRSSPPDPRPSPPLHSSLSAPASHPQNACPAQSQQQTTLRWPRSCEPPLAIAPAGREFPPPPPPVRSPHPAPVLRHAPRDTRRESAESAAACHPPESSAAPSPPDSPPHPGRARAACAFHPPPSPGRCRPARMRHPGRIRCAPDLNRHRWQKP
jgi:hypothetical protein